MCSFFDFFSDGVGPAFLHFLQALIEKRNPVRATKARVLRIFIIIPFIVMVMDYIFLSILRSTMLVGLSIFFSIHSKKREISRLRKTEDSMLEREIT